MYRVHAIPSLTDQQIHCHPQHALLPSSVGQLITHSIILLVVVNILRRLTFALASTFLYAESLIGTKHRKIRRIECNAKCRSPKIDM
jgi:hypothetical protein